MWFAVMAGLAQALIVAVMRLATHRLTLISADVVWMAPVADTAVFCFAAAALHMPTRRLGRSAAAGVAWGVFLFLWLLGPILLVPRLHPYAAVVLAAGVAVQSARMVRARAGRVDALIRRTLPALVVLVAVLGFGLQTSRVVLARRAEASLPPAAPGAPNVILIVLDTVRAANLSLYGYERTTSLNLDKFAQTGVVFERALSTSPWTLPSHASLFTGRLPHELSGDWQMPLDEAHTTLSETLAAQGYVTAGFAANLLYATEATGLGRGFLKYSDYQLSAGTLVHHSWLARALISPVRRVIGADDILVRIRGAQVTDNFLAWLAVRPKRPFFVFLNYFDAHEPYLPPPPYDAKFGDGGPLPDLNVRRTWSRREIRRSMDAYDGTLAYLDAQLGRLFETLRAQRIMEDTLIIITSDHGEQFGEHGLFDHASSLYRPVLQVPLVLSFPPRVPAGLRLSTPVSLIDLPATILDLAGSAGATTLPGRSLVQHWAPSPRSDQLAQPLFAEVSKGINLPPWLPVSKGSMQSVVVDGMHYIRNGDGSEELYDFERDLAEAENLVTRPDVQAKLAAARRAVETTLRRR